MITTKKGKAGEAKVTYDGYAGLQKQGKFLRMMNLQQYATLENQLAVDFRISPRAEFANPSILGPGTNWQNAIFRTAAEQSHNLSVSGGTDKSDYYISAGYFKQDGTVLGFNFDRYTIRGVVNSQAKPWLKIGSTFGGAWVITVVLSTMHYWPRQTRLYTTPMARSPVRLCPWALCPREALTRCSRRLTSVIRLTAAKC
jgi:hypothetical protein